MNIPYNAMRDEAPERIVWFVVCTICKWEDDETHSDQDEALSPDECPKCKGQDFDVKMDVV